MSDLKQELHRQLRVARATMLSKVTGLSEYDMRRPMTPTGTNLLGLVKHLAGVEYVYLGDSFDRPPPDTMSWVEDGTIWDGADMWATTDDTSEDLIALYRRAAAHGDATIDALDLDSAGSVPHWPEDRRATTLGVLLIRMVTETAQHAGHADIIRELVDGQAGNDANFATDVDWNEYVSSVQRAADSFSSDR
ncbi:MAG: DinB family protein [Ilumatobacteraceae bacterium]|nr:DinB family protein [Ilumatobacteraceae bacterium]